MNSIRNFFSILFQSPVFKNSGWGILANVIQTVFLSLFFVIIARVYDSADFAHFLIASTLLSNLSCIFFNGLRVMVYKRI
jgi:O-antigen/teichoic acid export membrane protein